MGGSGAIQSREVSSEDGSSLCVQEVWEGVATLLACSPGLYVFTIITPTGQ